MFKVDLESGETSVVTMPTDIVFDDGLVAPDEINNATGTGDREIRNLGKRFIPAKGYK